MLHAAPLGVGNREEHTRVVGLLDNASSGSYRQTAALLNLVYHLNGFAPPSVRYPLYSVGLHAVYPPNQYPTSSVGASSWERVRFSSSLAKGRK